MRYLNIYGIDRDMYDACSKETEEKKKEEGARQKTRGEKVQEYRVQQQKRKG